MRIQYIIYDMALQFITDIEKGNKERHQEVKFDSPKAELVWSPVTLTADCWLTADTYMCVVPQWCPFYLKLSNKIAKAF